MEDTLARGLKYVFSVHGITQAANSYLLLRSVARINTHTRTQAIYGPASFYSKIKLRYENNNKVMRKKKKAIYIYVVSK